jgi:hypothetical protein
LTRIAEVFGYIEINVAAYMMMPFASTGSFKPTPQRKWTCQAAETSVAEKAETGLSSVVIITRIFVVVLMFWCSCFCLLQLMFSVSLFSRN